MPANSRWDLIRGFKGLNNDVISLNDDFYHVLKITNIHFTIWFEFFICFLILSEQPVRHLDSLTHKHAPLHFYNQRTQYIFMLNLQHNSLRKPPQLNKLVLNIRPLIFYTINELQQSPPTPYASLPQLK